MEAARARGLRVPEDLSVVGFDDTQVARLASPQLTTIRQPMREMGTVASAPPSNWRLGRKSRLPPRRTGHPPDPPRLDGAASPRLISALLVVEPEQAAVFVRCRGREVFASVSLQDASPP